LCPITYEPRSNGPLKVLILKPSSLGDVVQALPVLRLIKAHLPDSEIYWWIDSNLAPLLKGDPDLTGLILFERRHWARPRNWVALWRNVRWMREQRFDWVIDLQSLARSGAFAWLARGRLTIGLDEAREGARGLYDVIIARPSAHAHAVDWYLAVLPALGVPLGRQFEWLPERPDVREALVKRWPLNGAPLLALQPGARWPNKRWPVEYYAELARRLATACPALRLVVLGASEDGALGATIAGAVGSSRAVDLTGKLSLPEMVECIRLSALMVTNDTGPMHVAAALGKPVIALFGPTDPRRTGPYQQLESVLQLALPCSPCLKPRCRWRRPLECLRALSPQAVLQEVQKRLATLPELRKVVE
jgi:lipopolysaccharide heptosyltransferase II